MFDYEKINSLNELEMLIYHYVMEHKQEVKYMTVRELAGAVHVSTSTVLRFCKKIGCDGYSEFRIRFKMYLKEEKEQPPAQALEEIRHFLETMESDHYEENLRAAAEMIRSAVQLIFVGIGTSGILGKYGARFFSNLGKFSQHIEDPYYPINTDMEKTVVIALSESGETQEVLRLAGRFQEHGCRLISITNKASTSLGRISDLNLTYYVTRRMVKEEYNITTQVPVLFLLEEIGRRQ